MQGNYGLALIGNDQFKTYELIVYKDKQNILIRAKLQPTFTYNLLRDNYASFFDDQQNNWSVRYDNAKDYTEFYTELEKRNVKIVEYHKTETNDNETTTDEIQIKPAENANVDDNQSDSSGAQIKANILSRMAKMGQAIIPVATQSSLSDCADSDSDISSISKPLPKSKHAEKSPVKSEKSELKQLPLTNFQSTEIVPMQQQFASPTVDPFNLFLAENRTHNCEIRMNLNQLSSKMDVVLKRLEQNDRDVAEENLLRTQMKALELKVANLTRELQEALNTNVDLQKKLLESKTKDEQFEKQIHEKQIYIKALEEDNARFKIYKTFVIEVTNCSDFHSIKEVCRKYERKDVILGQFCQFIYKKLIENDGVEQNIKVKYFIDKLNGAMQSFQNHIVKQIDLGNNTVPSDFVSKALPESTRNVTNYLIKEFEKNFKTEDTSVLKFDLDLSEFADD